MGARIRWVAARGELEALCKMARTLPRVAVDTEADSLHVYRAKLCLVQVATGQEVWLVDPLTLGREGMAPLTELLADPSVQKVMHGADYDLRVLNRELGAVVRGLADTQLAAQLSGMAAVGLAALLQQELGISVDKRFQRANWGQRPLAEELKAYAAGDAHYLLPLAERVEDRLEALGRVEWWREECAALEGVRWEEAPPDPCAFLRVKGASALRGVARDRLAALWAWREKIAAARDCPPFKVLRPETLLELALRPPDSVQELAAVRGVGSWLVEEKGRELLEVVAKAPPAPERPRVPAAPRDPQRSYPRVTLRVARDQVATELGLDPSVVATRASLEAVAGALPRSEGELARCLGRQWRTRVLAPSFLPLVAAWSQE